MDLTNIEEMLKYKKVLITGHQNPDSDSICSCIALGLALRKCGKDVDLYIKMLSDIYKDFNGSEMFTKNVDKDYDLVIALDSGDIGRIEDVKYQFDNAKCTFNIDHHISNTYYADYNYVEEVSSTGEFIYNILNNLNIEIDKDIAKAIFVAIISDTGLFQYNNTKSNTHRVVADLIDIGINTGELIRKYFFEKSVEESILYGKALLNLEMLYDKKLALSTLSLEEIKKLKIEPKNTSTIINQMAQIRGTEMTIFMYEPIPNNVKISFRSKEKYDVCELAKMLGGGGHKLAAGAITKGTLKEMKQKVLKLIEKNVEF